MFKKHSFLTLRIWKKKGRASSFPSRPSISIEREEENGGDGEEETEETASASF